MAKWLKAFSKTMAKPLDKRQIMGVINANDDSFFSGSRFQGEEAVAQIAQMIEQGADIIDIGAVSTRPFSDEVSVQEELKRLQPIIDTIAQEKLYQKITLSIDTFRHEVAAYALQNGFHIVNDISGLTDDNMASVVADYNATVVIMHKQGTPQNMQQNPHYDNVIISVDEFFARQIDKAKAFGINDIILDVGIGFGKRLADNIDLINHLGHFNHFGYPLLIGASRKSMIDHIYPTPIEDRLSGTLTLHQEVLRNGASIVRCHDVKPHKQMLSTFEALYGYS